MEASLVFSHGLPHRPTALAYDKIQSLIAIGNEKGTIRIFGREGLEVPLQNKPSIPINQLIFITNKGYLISITNDDTINLWSLREQPARKTHRLPLDNENVTKLYSIGSNWLCVGTNRGNIRVYRVVEGLAISNYTIPYYQCQCHGTERIKPGAVIDILEHPVEQKKLLLAFTGGLVVLWNLLTRQIVHHYHVGKLLTSLCWISSGKEFATSYYDGAIGVWSLKNNSGPENLFTPHDTQRKKSSSADDEKFSSIENLQCINDEGGPLFVFTGGTPYTDHTPYITVMRRKVMSKLQCDSDICDFIIVPTSPNAPQKCKLLLVLCKSGMMVFDISKVGKYSPQYSVPLVMNLHKPAVTSMEYVDKCSDNLIGSLYSVHSKQLAKDRTVKVEWPFSGGQWSIGALETLSSGLIIIGHCDGSIKFWLANSHSLQPSITIDTQKSFERVQTATHQQERGSSRDLPDTDELTSHLEEYCIIESPNHNNTPVNPMPHQPNDEDNLALNSGETDDFGQLYITKFSDGYLSDFCIVEKPSSSDLGVPVLDFFPVSHVILNNVDWSLTVVNIGLCVMIYSYQLSNPSTDIKCLSINLESPQSPDATDGPVFNCGWKASPRTPGPREEAGFYLEFCCQCVPPAKAADDVEITCVEYSSKFGILVIGLTCGLVIVDTIECTHLPVEVNEFDFIARKGRKKGLRKNSATPSKTAATAGTKRNNSQLCVKAVSIVELNTDRHSHTPTCCIWVGTDKGDVIMMTVNIESPDTEDQPNRLELSHREIFQKLHHPVINMSFLNEANDIISTPSQRCLFESSVGGVAEPLHAANVPEQQHIDEAIAADTIRHFNVKLVRQLPLDDSVFFAMVNEAGLLTLNSGDYINALNTRAEKVGYFLQQIIKPAASQNLPILLTVMENSKVPNLVELAKKIQEKLAKETAAVPASKMTKTQHVVLCSEILCKVCTFPDNKSKAVNDLVSTTSTAIAKTKACKITGHDFPCLISLTFSGEILVHSLPSLGKVAMASCELPLHDIRVLKTFHVAANGSSAVYMSSPSEVQRLSLLKLNDLGTGGHTQEAEPVRGAYL